MIVGWLLPLFNAHSLRDEVLLINPNSCMLSQLSINEPRNHCAVNLFSNIRICAKLDGKSNNFRNNLFNPLRRLDIGSGFLELCRLLHISPTLSEQHDNLTINAVNIGSNIFDGVALDINQKYVSLRFAQRPFPVFCRPSRSRQLRIFNKPPALSVVQESCVRNVLRPAIIAGRHLA